MQVSREGDRGLGPGKVPFFFFLVFVYLSAYVITSLPACVFPIFLDGQSLKKKRELIKGKGVCWVTKGGQMTLSPLLLFPADYRSLHVTV